MLWALCLLVSSAACSDFALEPDRTPTTLIISPEDTVLRVGETAQLRITVLDQDGNAFEPVPSWALARWSISEPDAVIISGDGKVEALGGGEVQVDADIAGLTTRIRLRINPLEVRLTAPAVYLSQGIQNLAGGVPLIAGRQGLLRVFVLGDLVSFFEPRVRASFFLDGEEIHSVVMEPGSYLTPSSVDESRLDRSYNALIPGSVLRPGVEMVVEVDPDRIVPLAEGSQVRIPAEGRMALEIRDLPRMSLTVVPVLLESGPNPQVFAWTGDITEESDNVEFSRAILPIGDFEVEVHAPFTTSSDLTTGPGWSAFLREISVLRLQEGGAGYYYGAVTLPPGSEYGGLGFLGFPVSVGRPSDKTLAHELGHNMNLRHAPCGGAGSPDSGFPYDGGEIGVWGYDFDGGGGLGAIVPPSTYKDLMGYCNPKWISDYHFSRALNFRENSEAASSNGQFQRVLLVWGSAGAGELELEPAFVIDAPVTLPTAPGPYRVQGFDSDGNQVFNLSFSPIQAEFGPGQFVFGIPYQEAWGTALAEITLSGPGGVSILRSTSGQALMAIVRDPGDGRIRAIVRSPGDLSAFGSGAEVLLSDGLRTQRITIDPR